MIKIEYGIDTNKKDVTEICKTKLCKNNVIFIPTNDHVRASYFGDPIVGVVKFVFVTLNDKINKFSVYEKIIINLDNKNIKYEYGIDTNKKDVTDICKTKLCKNDVIFIPTNDNVRASYFGDPIVGVEKCVFVTLNKQIYKFDIHEKLIIHNNFILSSINIIDKLNLIHSNLKFDYGNIKEELPEQLMSVISLNGDEKVLELGANIGRNTLVIASILNNSNNLVTFECDKQSSNMLTHNRDINNLKFNIETCALSKRKLIQKGWDTIPSNTLLNGYKWVNTITLQQLKQKYNINFDTLVLDCEGAFYYILLDMPEILNNIKKIIIENDYHDINHYNFMKNKLVENNFNLVFNEAGGWGPCSDFFYQIWAK
jgi:FkbM family methyltransferase